ncbi:MAG: tRNA 2-thiocytidine(32) synthetase TtcA [Pseudobdellovibrionaceae bacterium]|nr:tRNA 2-thiocytidine(32) synthetase TtcA [Bdellovibrionales bacterium]USN47904.1 MAG: tRNA 2-thiocytidine(32) synthetase TtcA [Pseudobdellovibrionaceae bacterium]
MQTETLASHLGIEKRLRHLVGEAIKDYAMITEGDRVMVCLSGGKDSYSLLDILRTLQKKAPVQFSLVAVNLDQKQPDYPADILPRYLEQLGIEYHILERDTYSVVKENIPAGKTMCSLCSRLRRGILYGFAEKIGATKIALGHHCEDLLETLFLNMFYAGKLKTMPPKLRSDDGKHILIRPLAYCPEPLIAQFAESRQFPIIPCNLCGSQENLQRKVIKKMLQQWESATPGRLDQILRSLKNVVPSHLADTQLFGFADLVPMSESESSLCSDSPLR